MLQHFLGLNAINYSSFEGMFVNRFEKLWKKIRKLGKKRNHFQRISNSHTTTSISLGAALSGIAREAVIETPQKPTVTGVNFYDSRIRNTRHNLKIGQEKEGGGREAPPYRYIDTWCVNINGKGINSPCYGRRCSVMGWKRVGWSTWPSINSVNCQFASFRGLYR